MSKNTTITIIIILLVLVGFYFWAPDSLKFWKGQTANVIDSGNQTSTTPHETITAKHQYKNGSHIIAGEANSPTPCDILTTTTSVRSDPFTATIDFVSKTSGEVCAQKITSNRFKVTFQGPESAVIQATWNGEPVELNLIPASPNDDLDNFEIYTKG